MSRQLSAARQSADPIEIEAYGPVARAVHWAVAALAVAVVALGWAMTGASRGGDLREVLLSLHRSVGVLILALMVFRVFWRLTHPPPPLPAGFPRLEAAAAHADHALLYIVFLVMPLTGLLNAAAAGHPVSVFGLFAIPPLLPGGPASGAGRGRNPSGRPVCRLCPGRGSCRRGADAPLCPAQPHPRSHAAAAPAAVALRGEGSLRLGGTRVRVRARAGIGMSVGGCVHSRCRVLIVDPDALRRRCLVDQLERDGEFAGTDCNSAAAALRRARARAIRRGRDRGRAARSARRRSVPRSPRAPGLPVRLPFWHRPMPTPTGRPGWPRVPPTGWLNRSGSATCWRGCAPACVTSRPRPAR